MGKVIPIRADIVIEPVPVQSVDAQYHETRERVEEWSDTIWLTAIKIGMRAGFDKAKTALEQALADIRAKADQP